MKVVLADGNGALGRRITADLTARGHDVVLLTRSRVAPTLALVGAAAALDQPPPAWIQMSRLAIYGDAGNAVLDERALPADRPPQMARGAGLGSCRDRGISGPAGCPAHRDRA